MKEILITSSVMILALLMLRQIFSKKVRRTLIYGAWVLVALRLLIPVQIGQLDFSVLSSAQPVTEAMTQISHKQVAGVTEQDAYREVLQDYIENDRTAFTPELQNHIQSSIESDMSGEEISVMIDKVYSEEEVFVPEVQERVHQQVAQTTDPITLGQIATVVWLVGVGVMAVWFAAVNLRNSYMLRQYREKLELDSPIPVFLSEAVESPCLVGPFRPAVYLTPEGTAREDMRHHVLTHELTHYRHADHIWALVRCICLCIYWFDPLVWLAAYVSRRDCELACDEGAIKQLGEDARIAYGKTLLDVVSHASAPGRLMHTATAMAETKKQLKQRVNFIARKPKWSALAAICMVLICVIVAGCAAAGPVGDSVSTEKNPGETTAKTTEPVSEEKNWEVSEAEQLQLKQDYVEYLSFSGHDCTVEDVQLIVVSRTESGYVVLISCKCGGFRPGVSWENLFVTKINDLEFYMPGGWFLQYCEEGIFYPLDGDVNLEYVAREVIITAWEDYYDQFPAAWEYYLKRHPPGSPNAAEEKMLQQYRSIVEFLENYDLYDSINDMVTEYGQGDEQDKIYTGTMAFQFCYQKLQEMEEVDQWIDYCKNNYSAEYSWDRLEYLRRFTVNEDVLLYQLCYGGNEELRFQKAYDHYYDSQGRRFYTEVGTELDFTMIEYIPPELADARYYILSYDKTGRVSRIDCNGYIFFPVYNDAGRMVSMTAQYRNDVCEILYTYDDAGRLSRVESPDYVTGRGKQLLEYTYDTDGKLLSKKQAFYSDVGFDGTLDLRRGEITEYVYNESGLLIAGTYTEQNWDHLYVNQDTYTFTYDAQGRLLQMDIVYGATCYMAGEKQGQLVNEPAFRYGRVEYIYGDYAYYEKP